MVLEQKNTILRPGKIKRVNEISVLVISNKYDFTTDYVCLELNKRNIKYLRLNRDEFDICSITLDLNSSSLMVEMVGEKYFTDDSLLKSIYYRAPVFLRDIYQPGIDERQQLYRTQWAAFVRNLSFYENVRWVNNPVSTYKAENKILQLKYARDIGFNIPVTKITNNNKQELNPERFYIVKTIEPAILRIGENEAFIYSNVVKGREILNSFLNSSPTVIQEYIYPKIDVRATVVGNDIFSVKILQDGIGVKGDWRKLKNVLNFEPFEMPRSISEKCIRLVRKLGLSFGALDLVVSGDKYYFLELNPTGEWAWLVNKSGLKIYKPICDMLERK